MLKKTFKLSGILFLIAFSTALLLGLTNEATKGVIAQAKMKEQVAAMKEIIPAQNYILLDQASDDCEIRAAYNGDELVGYAVSLSEHGYGGEINMMIGITNDNKVAGIKITSMSETPGLGENAQNPEFTDMFKNLSSEEVSLTSEGGKIQALTGATVTSKAVTAGVRRALDSVSEIKPGGETVGK